MLDFDRHAPRQLSSSFFGWILPVLKTPNAEVLEKVGLDAVVVSDYYPRRGGWRTHVAHSILCFLDASIPTHGGQTICALRFLWYGGALSH